MDESWRMRMGMANFPRRRSMEETSATRRNVFADSETLDPDFNDVFGGPPRSVISRKFSADFTARSRSNSFYEEVFRPPETSGAARSGRNLPVFRIPASKGGGGEVQMRREWFYSDIFGSDEDRRSRSRSKSKPNSKSKSNSSSVLSSEELSPLRPAISDDVAFSSFASKLRPINVKCRWNSSSMMPEEYPTKPGIPAFSCNRPSYTENQFVENEYNENFRSSHFGFSRRVSSPETISLEHNSYRNVKISVDDLELNSPSSVVSSLQEPEARGRIQEQVLREQEVELEEDDEVMSSYVIEITSDHREGSGEADDIDEAIAWAKEKYRTQSPEKEWSARQHEKEGSVKTEEMPKASEFSDGHGTMRSTVEEEPKKWAMEEEKQQSENDTEMALLDEDISLWSAGKEANIRLLLSTLHHILWPNSGWYAIPLTNLIETSHVRKAYQKARLCLHPDKLQQRGATLPQKYLADKAFTILQDAWAAFISQDVFFS